jgi:hypothetical protein
MTGLNLEQRPAGTVARAARHAIFRKEVLD